MNRFALYDSLGVIDSIFTGGEESARDQGFNFLPCGPTDSDVSHFVDISEEHEIKPRMALNTRLDTRGLSVTVTGLALGTRLSVEEVEVISDSERVEIEFDAPGTYEIRIYPPPQYRDEVLEVTVG